MGVGSLSRNLGTNYEVGGAGTSDSSVGSGNASKAGTDEEKWKNEIDWLYNLLEDINEVIRDREKLEHRYERLLEQRNASLSDLIELQDAQFENLRTQKKLEEERLEKRKQEMREYIKENADISEKYGIKFNENDMTIEINWEEIDKITDEEEGEEVNNMISRLEEIQDEIDEAEDSLMSATTDSVVKNTPATDAAFSNALLVTLVGSIIPLSTISVYSLVKALKP